MSNKIRFEFFNACFSVRLIVQPQTKKKCHTIIWPLTKDSTVDLQRNRTLHRNLKLIWSHELVQLFPMAVLYLSSSGHLFVIRTQLQRLNYIRSTSFCDVVHVYMRHSKYFIHFSSTFRDSNIIWPLWTTIFSISFCWRILHFLFC